jgi:hypothetical protein
MIQTLARKVPQFPSLLYPQLPDVAVTNIRFYFMVRGE